MGLKELTCPKCGASIKVKDGQRINFCTYCGQAMEYDDGVKRTENKHIYQDLTIEKALELQKEQLKMAYEENERVRQNADKMLPWAVGIVVFMIGISLIGSRCSKEEPSKSGSVSYEICLGTQI